MKKIDFLKGIFLIVTLMSFISCTDLDEQILDGSSKESPVNAGSLLITAYRGLRDFQDQGMTFTMSEMSTDALVGPTRGGDWDDNAKWRSFHVHQWDAENDEIRKAYNFLLSTVNDCNVIVANGSGLEVTEARFIRAFCYYHVVDLFGKAPYREKGSPITDDPKVYTRAQATAYIISELESILPNLPNRKSGEPDKANKDAGHFLLAKIYLNKAVFNAANPAGPYTFSTADMNKVVEHVDAMTNKLSTEYWDNFSPTNNNSDEIVFTSKNEAGNSGNLRSRWRMGAHYAQKPDGWNGFCTIAEYYDRFNPNDKRINYPKQSVLETSGYNLGFQIGQMKNGKDTDENGKPKANTPAGSINLKDRKGNPLVFTKTVSMFTSGATLETAGIRGVKYEPDLDATGKDDNFRNDYVLMRYSDALLMKAEAIARGGSGSIGTIMSDIAARTGTGDAPSPATLDGIYLERGKELWWEGWRRNDMIRFGKFLQGRELKSGVSDSKYLLYPLPTAALYNPNMTQNPGY